MYQNEFIMNIYCVALQTKSTLSGLANQYPVCVGLKSFYEMPKVKISRTEYNYQEQNLNITGIITSYFQLEKLFTLTR